MTRPCVAPRPPAALPIPYAVPIDPERIVRGSDWPHVNDFNQTPDAAALSGLPGDWLPKAEGRHRVPVDNAARLYGFSR